MIAYTPQCMGTVWMQCSECMDNAIAIRRATVRDAAQLALHRAGMFRDMGQLAPENEAALVEASTAYFLRAVPDAEYVAWVAEAGGRIVAGAGVQLRSLLPRPTPDGKELVLGLEGIVLNVYVEHEWRRRGIARELMNRVIAWARTGAIVRLVLHPSSDGRPLYVAMGFVPTDELRFSGSLTR